MVGTRPAAALPPRAEGISVEEAVEHLTRGEGNEGDLFERAVEARRRHRGNRAVLCAILNAKSGACGEDCAFCAQSSHARTRVETYPLVSAARMVEAARCAAAMGAARIGIVTSGKGLGSSRDVDVVAAAVEEIAATLPIEPCASLGHVTAEVLARLKAAGLSRYHHNLETAESFFHSVCSTRRWSESVDTVRLAHAAGLHTCCGGIFGLGETPAQRVELLAAVRDLGADSVPLNFLNPIPGTRLGGMPLLDPGECLKIVAVARLMMPDREIRVCGGREAALGAEQSRIFDAGADGMMVGGYLTVAGREAAEDRRMVLEAGMEIAGPGTGESAGSGGR